MKKALSLLLCLALCLSLVPAAFAADTGDIVIAEDEEIIDIIDPVTLEAVDSVILEQLRPETSGDTAFVFYHDAIHAFCVIDTNGNCFAAGKAQGEKRWSKRIIWNGGAAKR
jgi:hypothetical protein